MTLLSNLHAFNDDIIACLIYVINYDFLLWFAYLLEQLNKKFVSLTGHNKADIQMEFFLNQFLFE